MAICFKPREICSAIRSLVVCCRAPDLIDTLIFARLREILTLALADSRLKVKTPSSGRYCPQNCVADIWCISPTVREAPGFRYTFRALPNGRANAPLRASTSNTNLGPYPSQLFA